jgi:hypothetical protein
MIPDICIRALPYELPGIIARAVNFNNQVIIPFQV